MHDTESELIPWSLKDVIEHLDGTKTYGHYIVSPKNECRVIVFDVDLRAKANTAAGEEPIMFDGSEIDPREVWGGAGGAAKRDLALQLRALTEGFANKGHKITGLPVMVTYSGAKGMHAYVCLDPGTPASEAREMAHLVIDSFEGDIVPDKGKNFFRHATGFKALSVEVFPKQDTISPDGGFGNLVRLPLGVNQKSGKRGFFIDLSTPQDVFKLDDPMAALSKGSIRGR
jgi:hypothetical protein